MSKEEFRVIGKINVWDRTKELIADTIFQDYAAAHSYITEHIAPHGEGTILRVVTADDDGKPTVVDRVAAMHAELKGLTTPWEKDGCIPANYIRKDGMGVVLAKVDRWAGGYQKTHAPIIIGWEARDPNNKGHSDSGVLLVSDFDDLVDTMSAAKDQCDARLRGFAPGLELG